METHQVTPSEPLITKYRPQAFDEVLGHQEVIDNLLRTLDSNSSVHSYLLYGPSGVGKTTLARIIAKHFKAEVIEIDAATYNGVDAMRALCETGRHMSLRGAGIRMFVMNEVQRLSRGAWDALLTILEEPPPHLYFALTTTEFDKIPPAVLTRCYQIKLDSIAQREIEDLLEQVIKDEGWEVKDDVFQAIVTAANGSPRQALSLLQQGWSADDRDELARITSIGSAPLMDLIKFILAGKRGWGPIQNSLSRLTDDDFENGIVIAGRYIGGAMVRSKSEKDAMAAWALLEALVFPTSTYDRKIAFYTAIGRVLWGGT